MTEINAVTLTVGAVFHGRYKVVRLINAGSMGAVYEVLDSLTDSARALKIMLPSVVQDADLRNRFEQEAKVTGGIESDHIVRVSDAGVDAETHAPFLVMDLLRGDELGMLVKKRSGLPPAEVLTYLSQAARALDKTHARGIVHRDLKPENMFVTHHDDGSPSLKILDFGIAKVMVDSGQAAKATRPMGTPLYMAPEQIRGDPNIGPAADIHALGHIAYTLLVGEAYWTEEASRSAMYALLSTILEGMQEAPTARALRRRSVTLPPEFDAWLTKSVTLDAAARFQSSSEAIAALRTVFGIRASNPSVAQFDNNVLPAQSNVAPTSGGTVAISPEVPKPAASSAPVIALTATPSTGASNGAGQTNTEMSGTAPTIAVGAKKSPMPFVLIGLVAAAAIGFVVMRASSGSSTTPDKLTVAAPPPPVSASIEAPAIALVNPAAPSAEAPIAPTTASVAAANSSAKFNAKSAPTGSTKKKAAAFEGLF